jgi:hypothetical protein
VREAALCLTVALMRLYWFFIGALLCACSTSSTTPGPEQVAGSACDPALGERACLQGLDICKTTDCDREARTCTIRPSGYPLCTDDGRVRTDAGPDAAPIDGGQACASSADCPSGQGCGFLMTDACLAKGSCQPYIGGACLGVPICACDGTVTRGCSFANGYAEAPVFFPLRIATREGCGGDGGSDAGPD